MPDWSELLGPLTVPRENGTPGLERAAEHLVAQLEVTGAGVELQPVLAHPNDPAALGLAILVLCLAYAWALRGGRSWLATGLAALLLALPVAHLDFQLPLTPGLGVVEHNVIATLGAERPERRLLLAAHYDTKTELVDHVVRLPVRIVGAALGLLALGVAVLRALSARGRRPARALVVAAPLYGAVFAALSPAGAWLAARSPGALDDGAACAVLVRAAAELAAGPGLDRTEVQVVLFAAEETAAEGSWAFVRERRAELAALETLVVNFDPVGASQRFTVVGGEGALLRRARPAASLLALLDAAHRRATGRAIEQTSGGGLTDAFPFLLNDIAAATVISAVPPFVLPRGMHTSADRAERIDPAHLDAALALVLALVDVLETPPVPADLASRRLRPE